MMTPTSSRAMAASPWYNACSSWRKRSPTATTPSKPKTIPGSRVDDAGGSEATSVSTPKARNGRGSSPCNSRAIDDFPELDAPLRTITALRTPTTVAQVGPRPMANCFPAGPTLTDAQNLRRGRQRTGPRCAGRGSVIGRRRTVRPMVCDTEAASAGGRRCGGTGLAPHGGRSCQSRSSAVKGERERCSWGLGGVRLATAAVG